MATWIDRLTDPQGYRGDPAEAGVPTPQVVLASDNTVHLVSGSATDSASGKYANKHRDFAETRDAEIEELLLKDPMTARMLVDMEVLPNMSVANRRLNRLARKRSGKIRKLSTQAYLDGRWHCVYFAGPYFGANMVPHHTEVSRLVWSFDCDRHERWNVPCNADAHLWIDGTEYLLENCRGNDNDALMRKRVERLKDWNGTILWVCKNRTRVREVVRLTKPIHDRCLYTTYEQAADDPHAAIWAFADGLVTDFPRVNEPLDTVPLGLQADAGAGSNY